jgi:hypothetical protein
MICISTVIISSLRIMSIGNPADMTYSAVSLLSWSTAEVASALTCAAIPTLKPLATRYLPNFGSQHSHPTNNSQGNSHGLIYRDSKKSKSSSISAQSTRHLNSKEDNIDLGPVFRLSDGDLEATGC